VVFFVLICNPASVLRFVIFFTVSCSSQLDLVKRKHHSRP
jgi:hypothetical protein